MTRTLIEQLFQAIPLAILIMLANNPADTEEDLWVEQRLMADKFLGYNSLIRPARHHAGPPINVGLQLALVLLISVNEKDQIMQTNVWLTFEWEDFRLSWSPENYGGIESMRLPPEKVWLPDVVLFNNADGRYEVTYHSNVVVRFTGQVLWVPPAIYKSSCHIDVQYFPFDQQVCSMHFGSWTYGPNEVALTYLRNKSNVELNDYTPSGIWDVIDAPASVMDDKATISYRIVIRRKTLFYTIMLIIPAILMAFLSTTVFYLPADCSEKITLAISILLALVVFLLLVSKILPPNSDTIPLMAKYLLLTFVMNIATLFTAVTITNTYFRNPSTKASIHWLVRRIFLRFIPGLLLMKVVHRKVTKKKKVPPKRDSSMEALMSMKIQDDHHPNCKLINNKGLSVDEESNIFDEKHYEELLKAAEIRDACASIRSISERMRAEIKREEAREMTAYILDSDTLLSDEGGMAFSGYGYRPHQPSYISRGDGGRHNWDRHQFSAWFHSV